MKKLKILLLIVTALILSTGAMADGIRIDSKGANSAEKAAIALNTAKDTNVPVSTDPVWTAAGELVIGTGAATSHKLNAGALTDILVGGGAADPVWTTATGSGEPVRATSPTLSTPDAVSTDTIFDAAGDLVQGSGANASSKLPIGAANLKLFVNAGGTLGEWAGGMKIGTFTIDTATASGTQPITELGFKPSYIIFLAHATAHEFSIGFSGNLANCVYATAAGVRDSSASESIYLYQSAGVTYAGAVSAFGADGFTVTWVKAGSKTGTAWIYYMAFR